jgi:hypothetical protein
MKNLKHDIPATGNMVDKSGKFITMAASLSVSEAKKMSKGRGYSSIHPLRSWLMM